MKLSVAIAGAVLARENAVRAKSSDGAQRHQERAVKLVKDHMPSGSGINSPVLIDWDKTSAEKLVFSVAYHHMNQDGFYDGWTYHKVIVTPSLYFGHNLKITGRDKNGIKEYLYDTFNAALDEEVNEYSEEAKKI